MKFNNPILLNAVANTGTKMSQAIPTQFMWSGSFQATFTDGSAAGTLVIQASNDPIELLPSGETPVSWTNIANAQATVTSGGSVLITIANLNYRWIRCSWTQSAGAQTLTVTAFLQGV